MSESRSTTRLLLVGAIVLLLILVAAQFIAVWHAKDRLSAALAQLRTAGDPISLANLKPASIVDSENAAAHLARIRNDLAAFETTYFQQFEDTRLGRSWTNAEMRGELPTPEQLAAMKGVVESYPTIVQVLRRAAECPNYSSRAIFDRGIIKYADYQLEFGQSSRALARFVSAKSTVFVADGKRDEAVRLGIDLLRVTRHYDSEPLQVPLLVSMAIRGMAVYSLNDVLRRGPISTEVSSELDAELTRHDLLRALGESLRSERAYAITLIDEYDDGIGCTLRWPKLNWQSDLIDCYSDAIVLTKLQWFEGQKELATLQKKVASANTGAFREKSVFIEPTYRAANRVTAELRCLRILNALGAFTRTHGREAARLGELALPKSAIIDPFTGQQLKLVQTEKGWIIYSVMHDGIDGGGDFTSFNDCGVAPLGHGYDPTISEDAEEKTDQESETP